MLTNRHSTMMVPPNRRSTIHHPEPLLNLGSLTPENEPHCPSSSILTSTTPSLPGYRVVRVIGVVYGSTAYALKDTKSLFKSLITGSEVKSLTHMMYNARDQAMERLARDCVARGANAVVAVAFEEKELLGFVQVSVCGTAVYAEREKQPENPFSPE
ncbi:putative heavy-metal-binding-domain-containing protein [Hypoxylon cercidicola]|nr:putative heavy-metal-binding-domain-containing protein [Hypoxylon cercidicola]